MLLVFIKKKRKEKKNFYQSPDVSFSQYVEYSIVIVCRLFSLFQEPSFIYHILVYCCPGIILPRRERIRLWHASCYNAVIYVVIYSRY